VNRTHQVDGDHLGPLLVGQPVNGPPRGNSGDVHHDVHARVTGVDVDGERGDVVIVGDIQRPVLGHLCAQRASVGHGQCQTLGVAVGQVELGTFAGKPQCGRAANTAGRTGDKRPLAREIRLRHGG
jgi:hypothetical protein